MPSLQRTVHCVTHHVRVTLHGLSIAVVAWLGFSGTAFGQAAIPEWCRPLPRPEYKSLERVPTSDTWFEVYKVAPGVFAIYEPHQSEETISYLVLGEKRALLFDTGMGISDLRKVTNELTRLPIVVLNSHTHDDHVGDNWQCRDTRPMRFHCSIAPTDCCSPGTPTILRRFGCIVLKQISRPTMRRSGGWLRSRRR